MAARQILDSLFLSLYVIDDDFTLQDLNAAALRHVDEAFFHAIAKDTKCYALIYKRKEPCPFCPLLIEKERQLLENSPTPIEKIIHNVVESDTQPNGSEELESIEKSYRVFFLQVPHKKKRLLLESIEDITTQQEDQDKALRNENLAALGVMVSGISHELNNAFTGMGLNLQNLIANHLSMKDDELLQRLEILRKDLHQASQIISDIRLFSNPSHSSRPRFTKAKILQTANKAVAAVKRLYPILSRPIEWEVIGEEIIFAFKPESIERLLINLFRNSLQAFDYKPGKIRLQLKQAEKAVHIIVEDNAGGIERSRLKKVFQPFYSNTPGTTASGLGLSICHSIVREHQGHIHVRSVADRTLFYISLPLDLKNK